MSQIGNPAASFSGPTGPAGGDLTGTYPNPTLAWITRTAAQTLAIGSGGTLAVLAFLVPGSGVATALGNTAGGAGGFALVGTTPPTGASGGDLAGTYPNPTLNTSISTAVAFSGLGVTTIEKDAIGVTSTDGLILNNATAAISGTSQYSPRIRLSGQGFKTFGGTASQTVDWIIENQPSNLVAATPTAGLLVFSAQSAGGGYVGKLALDTRGYFNIASPGAAFQINNGTTLLFNVSSANATIIGGANIQPLTNAGQALGTTTLGWNNAFLSSAAQLAWNNDTFQTRGGAATLQLGVANAASPVAQTLQAQGSRAGTDSNVGGGNLTIKSGQGTGTGVASDLIFQTPILAASGSGAQTMTTALTLKGATQRTVAATTIGTAGYTVATLPAGVIGDRTYVTDALAPTFLATIVGGGAINTPVYYNGANWVGA